MALITCSRCSSMQSMQQFNGESGGTFACQATSFRYCHLSQLWMCLYPMQCIICTQMDTSDSPRLSWALQYLLLHCPLLRDSQVQLNFCSDWSDILLLGLRVAGQSWGPAPDSSNTVTELSVIQWLARKLNHNTVQSVTAGNLPG